MALVIVAFTVDRSAETPPLAYLPVLNPLDLAQLAALTVALAWYLDLRGTDPDAELIAVAPAVIGATAFLWFNGLLARTAHHYAGVAFSWPALWESLDVSGGGLRVMVAAFSHSNRLGEPAQRADGLDSSALPC